MAQLFNVRLFGRAPAVFYVPQVNGVVGGRSILDGKKKKKETSSHFRLASIVSVGWLGWPAQRSIKNSIISVYNDVGVVTPGSHTISFSF